jgi:hypothetical protein
VLAWHLVRDYFDKHRPNCGTCRTAVEPCPHLQRAIAHVTEFRNARRLLTIAEELRLERATQLATLPLRPGGLTAPPPASAITRRGTEGATYEP